MASPTLAWVSSTVRMITRVSGTDLVICWVALMPPRPGMRTSMMTTSGWVRWASWMASSPSPASATTSRSSSSASAALMPSLMSGWSSATRMRTRSLTCASSSAEWVSTAWRPAPARRWQATTDEKWYDSDEGNGRVSAPGRPGAGRVEGGSGDADAAALPAAHGPALLLGEPAPDAGVLGGVEGPLQALFTHGAERADRLGRLDLRLGRPGCPNREEELRVHIAAAGTMAPIH